MRKLSIKLPKTSYTPGEEISGVLEIDCDKPFDSEGTSISIQGIQKVSAEDLAKVTDDAIEIEIETVIRPLLKEEILLSPPKRFEAGTHKFEFTFHLPPSTYHRRDNLRISSGLIPSFDGKHASVEYSIQAEIEGKRFRDVRTRTPLFIHIPIEKKSRELKMSVVEKEMRIVEVEADALDFCIGSPIALRCRLNNYELLSKVRFEIVHREFTQIKHASNSHSRSLCRKDVRPRKQDLERWQTLVLELQKNMPQSFKTEHITSETVLKVSTQLTDYSKKENLVHLMAIHCPIKKTKSETTKYTCPNCQKELGDITGVVRPDGSLICPKCFKRFIPEK